MKHYLIHPTWQCQNSCSYCWVENTIRNRPDLFNAPPATICEWNTALLRDTPDAVHIAGGEPFLSPVTIPLIEAWGDVVEFSLSTNGLCTNQIDILTNHSHLSKLTSVNVSYHPEQITLEKQSRHLHTISALQEHGYEVIVNIVNYQNNIYDSFQYLRNLKALGVNVVISPYEDSSCLHTLTHNPLQCQAGITHLVIAPDGRAWPCLTTLRSPFYPVYCLGNWIDGLPEDISTHVPYPCYLDCHDYKLKREHIGGDIWGTNPTPYSEP